MRALPVVPVLLLLAACSGNDPEPAPSATPAPVVTTAAPTPSATATPTATAAPTATATRAVEAVEGDVDGDGKPDTTSSREGLLVVRLSSTRTSVTAVVHAEMPGPPPILGTADIDRDGRVEVFLQTAEGASTGFATPYRYDGKALREMTLDGMTARLGFGGGVTHGDGFRCLPSGEVEVRQATSSDGRSYSVKATVYRVSGAALVQVSSRTESGAQGSPAVQASYTADCGSVSG